MERYFFYTSNQGRGYKYPLVKNEQGEVMVYDRKTIKPLPQFTDKLLHDNLVLEKEQIDRFVNKCIEVKVNSIDGLCGWLDKYDNLVSKKQAAEEFLRDADNNLLKILKEETNMYPDMYCDKPKKSYAETKTMGCTDIVYWEYESIINPETGNEFFRPEQAKEILENRKKEYLEKYKDELAEKEKMQNEGGDLNFPGEIENIDDSCYIWDAGDYLDDLIDEEKLKEASSH